jgi:tRNA pseudouridine38-40 synthase
LRYFIELSYKGTAYHGWQSQPDVVSVQETIEKSLSLLLRYPTKITGAGRTDAGVHARQMFAHFDTEMPVDKNLVYKLNAFLPSDIAIHNIYMVSNEAHARFDAVLRSYQYHIHTKKNPFIDDFSWYYKQQLDVKKMNEAAKSLLFFDDFKSFSKSKTDVKTYICNVEKAQWKLTDDQLVFYISADRFLRNMVRAIVGTLIQVGLHKIDVADFIKIIEARNRIKAGFSVPAHGLYLTQIIYPDQIFIPWN